MSDAGTKYTDKKIKKLEKAIHEVYSEAQKDIEAKFLEHEQKFSIKNKIHEKQVDSGEWEWEEYSNWLDGQIFQGEQWEDKKNHIINTITNANKISTALINGESVDVFAFNSNFQAWELESGAGIDLGFDIYDPASVVNLIKNDPQMLPKWKINEAKDYIWNQKIVNNAIRQGIIQGERLDQISKRLVKGLVTKNENKMDMFARTAMTGAQNAGRDQRLMETKALGCNIVKEWMATLDTRTRDSHADLDGQQIKVGDKWHPMKFSNGCRYPGDPSGPANEVYNCRCTLVGDLVDYPAEYERRDQLNDKVIKNMSYKEWAKEKGIIQKKKDLGTVAIDYSKYGSKEALDIIKKYNYDWKNLLNAPNEDFDVLFYLPEFSTEKAQEWIANAKADEAILKKTKKIQPIKKKTEEEIAKEKYEKAVNNLSKLEQEVKDKGADKVFTGIWQKDITYADWEEKKGSIQAKKDYYTDKIAKYKKTFYEDFDVTDEEGEKLFNALTKYSGNKNEALKDHVVIDFINSDIFDEDDFDDVWSMFKGAENKVKEINDLLDQLGEFEKNGEQYYNLLDKVKKAKQEAQTLKPKPKASEIFSGDAYSQGRKDMAVWAKTPRDADNVLRKNTGEVWRNATDGERYAIYEYTSSYSKYNEPLRGWEYGQSNYSTGSGFKGVGKTDLNAGRARNGENLNNMTSIIDKCSYDEDVWLQRGTGYGGMDKFFNCSDELLRHGTQEELENALLGTTPVEYGFMSCGSSKGNGFSSNPIILNIYAPSGTKMMYVEPFSAFGNGSGSSWDGIKSQGSFGHELETILQQGTKFRVAKIERSNGKLYFDLDVISQDDVQLYKK